jgi:hypothetical protein
VIKLPKNGFFYYCEGCKSFYKVKPSEWIEDFMKRSKIDTWVVARMCDACKKKRLDDAQEESK